MLRAPGRRGLLVTVNALGVPPACRRHRLQSRSGTSIKEFEPMSQQPIHVPTPSGRLGVIRYSLCVLVAGTLLVGVGCSSPYVAHTPPPSAYRSVAYRSVPNQSGDKKVEVISEPAGARIEVNDDYVGDAPITLQIPQDAQDPGYFTKNTVIRAVPTEGGDYVQTKVFLGNISGVSYGDRIPSRLFFDMRLGPATPTVNVNVIPSN